MWSICVVQYNAFIHRSKCITCHHCKLLPSRHQLWVTVREIVQITWVPVFLQAALVHCCLTTISHLMCYSIWLWLHLEAEFLHVSTIQKQWAMHKYYHRFMYIICQSCSVIQTIRRILSTRYLAKLSFIPQALSISKEGRWKLGGKGDKKGRKKNASGKNSIHVHSKHRFEKLFSEYLWHFSSSAAGLLVCTRWGLKRFRKKTHSSTKVTSWKKSGCSAILAIRWCYCKIECFQIKELNMKLKCPVDEHLPQLMSQNCRLRIWQTLRHTGTWAAYGSSRSLHAQLDLLPSRTWESFVIQCV